MKLIDLLDEIKINKPKTTFTVTDKGKEWIQNYESFWDLYYFFSMETEIFAYETSENF